MQNKKSDDRAIYDLFRKAPTEEAANDVIERLAGITSAKEKLEYLKNTFGYDFRVIAREGKWDDEEQDALTTYEAVLYSAVEQNKKAYSASFQDEEMSQKSLDEEIKDALTSLATALESEKKRKFRRYCCSCFKQQVRRILAR